MIYVICAGDSLTFGTGSSDAATKSYPAQMTLGAGYTVTKTAVPGEMIASGNMLDRVLDELALISPGETVIVCYVEGNNDLGTNESTANVISYINAFITSVRAAYSGVIMVGLTMTKYVGITPTLDGRWDTVNAHILSTADNDYTADLESDPRLNDPSDLTYFDADGAHNNDAGYAVRAELVQAVIEGISGGITTLTVTTLVCTNLVIGG